MLCVVFFEVLGKVRKNGQLHDVQPSVFIVVIGSGDRIRTYDLRVMSPTSYLTAPPRVMNVRL